MDIMKYYSKGGIDNDNEKYRRDNRRCRCIADRLRAAAHLEAPLAANGRYGYCENYGLDQPRYDIEDRNGLHRLLNIREDREVKAYDPDDHPAHDRKYACEYREDRHCE